MNLGKLDLMAEQLKEKNIRIYADLVGAVLFMVLGMFLFLVMPKQVPVAESDVVNGRAFPTLLIGLMIFCSILLIIQNLIKIYKKETVHMITLNVLTEIKALIILLILIITFVICEVTNLFVAGAVFCAVCFLGYFRCRKRNYYVITIGMAVAIWAVFRFALGVRF